MRNLQMMATAIVLTSLVSGCQQPPRPDDVVCANSGHQPGTDGFVNCMAQPSQAHARGLGLNVPLYDETAYYRAVRNLWFGTGDYATDQPSR